MHELYTGMTDEQKRTVVLPWNHGAGEGQIAHPAGHVQRPDRGTHRPIYTQPQQELSQRILRAISSDEEGYRRITRNDTFDGSRLASHGCGAHHLRRPDERRDSSPGSSRATT